jgi:hypothetical protein
MEMRIDDVNLFYDEFFAAVGRVLRADASPAGARSGRRSSAAAAAADDRRVQRADAGGGAAVRAGAAPPGDAARASSLRIVVTTRDPFEAVLASFTLNNPNLGDWHTVEVGPFTEPELAKLLGLLGRAGGRRRRADRGGARHVGDGPEAGAVPVLQPVQG